MASGDKGHEKKKKKGESPEWAGSHAPSDQVNVTWEGDARAKP